MQSIPHSELIAELESAKCDDWGSRALLACVRKLRDSGPTEVASVIVEDACATTDEFRVATRDVATPEEIGREVADFNIGEPLGACGDILDFDADGLGWWGHISLRRYS